MNKEYWLIEQKTGQYNINGRLPKPLKLRDKFIAKNIKEATEEFFKRNKKSKNHFSWVVAESKRWFN